MKRKIMAGVMMLFLGMVMVSCVGAFGNMKVLQGPVAKSN